MRTRLSISTFPRTILPLIALPFPLYIWIALLNSFKFKLNPREMPSSKSEAKKNIQIYDIFTFQSAEVSDTINNATVTVIKATVINVEWRKNISLFMCLGLSLAVKRLAFLLLMLNKCIKFHELNLLFVCFTMDTYMQCK